MDNMANRIIAVDKLAMSDFVTLTPAEAHAAQKMHIPTLRGVLYEVDEFGNYIFKKSNTVVLGGSINTLEKLTGQFASYRPTSMSVEYNKTMAFPIPDSIGSYSAANYENDWEVERDSTISMFGVGMGGAGDTFGEVYDPDFRQNSITTWLPFRVSSVPSLNVGGSTLYGSEYREERNKYHFLRFNTTQGAPVSSRYGWYLKEFDSVAQPKSLWKNAPNLKSDGTEIASSNDVLNGPAGVGIETLVEFVIHISSDDIYEYFKANGLTNVSRYNTIGLFTAKLETPGAMTTPDGWKVSSSSILADGWKEAYNVRLFSVVTFNNMALQQKPDITYAYRIYSSL